MGIVSNVQSGFAVVCFVQPTGAVFAGRPQTAQKPVGGTLRAWGRGRERLAAGKLVGFQACPHLNDSNTQVFITLKNDNQLQGGITLMHFLFDFLA